MTGSFDRKTLIALFDELAEELARTRTRAQIYVVGGAVMTLEHSRESGTADVDARIDEGRYEVREAARRIARRHGLGDDWLSEDVLPEIPRTTDTTARTLYKSRFLTIQGASPRHLLAMKLEAARERDVEDIKTLMQELGMTTVEDGASVHRELFPNRDLKTRARAILEKIATGAS